MNLKRENIFLTSKLWGTCFRKEKGEKCLRNTLKDLRTEYLDLYLLHWPFAFKQKEDLESLKTQEGFPILDNVPLKETWQMMESFVDRGLVRNIGVSNFSVNQIKEILSFARIKPFVNQIECHPFLPEDKVIKYCFTNDIKVTAYSPLGGGRGIKDLLSNPIVLKASQDAKITPAQVLLAWNLQRGLSVIPKTAHYQRAKENFVDFTVDPKHLQEISKISERHRFCDPKTFWNIPYPE